MFQYPKVTFHDKISGDTYDALDLANSELPDDFEVIMVVVREGQKPKWAKVAVKQVRLSCAKAWQSLLESLM
jgi:hypothetical protein